MYRLVSVQFSLCSVYTSSAILAAYSDSFVYLELFFRMASLLLRWCHCVAVRRYIRIECEGFKLCTPALINVVCLAEFGR